MSNSIRKEKNSSTTAACMTTTIGYLALGKKRLQAHKLSSQSLLTSLKTWQGTFLKTPDWGRRTLKVKLFSGTTSWPEIVQHLACLQHSIWHFHRRFRMNFHSEKILESSQNIQHTLLRSARLNMSCVGTWLFTTLGDCFPRWQFTFLKLKIHSPHTSNQST